MSSDRYMTAREAANALNVSVSTLYAYVSRGLIRSEEARDGGRQRRYHTEDVERLLARKAGRKNPEKLAQDALHWGTPVLDSELTLIADGRLFYRGHDAVMLATSHTVEEVAALLWTGSTDDAPRIFSADVRPDAHKYETMLLHLEVDGANLTAIHALQTCLPIAAADDPAAYDLRPQTVMRNGARILSLMTSIIAGDVPDDLSLVAMLQRGWLPDNPAAEPLLRAAIIVCADHELNASSFAARVVASAGGTPYGVVSAGLAALQGARHGGHVERVAALFREARQPAEVREVLASRLRRDEAIPGFGHRLYPDGDPRAALLLDLIAAHMPDAPTVALALATTTAAAHLIGDHPNIDFALVVLAQALGLPNGAPLALFSLGRSIGWIAHAIEQYDSGRIIRPRARYTGTSPQTKSPS